MSRIKDLIGKRFGRLIVLDNCNNKKLCKCDCGKYVYVLTNHLTLGHTQSCGCLQKEKVKTIKGLCKTRLHKIWESMHARCYCEKHKSYNIYKNINICELWNKRENKNAFLNFYDWAIKNGYKDDLTIDRINGALGYCPENCRWISYKQQNRNLSTNVIISYNGKNYILKDACQLAKISESGVKHTVSRKGISHQDSFDLHLNYYFDVKLQKWVKKW